MVNINHMPDCGWTTGPNCTCGADPGRMTDEALRVAAQGCTELTCLYHGDINAEIKSRVFERAVPKDEGREP